MNEIINKFLLEGDKYMPEMYLRQARFTCSTCRPFTKTKTKYKNLKKQEFQNIFIKISYINLAFNMTWLRKILKIYLEEQLQIKY